MSPGLAVVLLASVSLCGCGTEPSDSGAARPSQVGFQTGVRTSLIEEGRKHYNLYCAGCHGETGDGKGEAARFLDPKPRDFQLAKYKFSTNRAGQLPTDDDLRRTITKGLKGSAMPGWDMLPPRTVGSLITYLKTLSPRWETSPDAAPIPRVDDPYRGAEGRSAAIARGEAVYHGFSTCWTCHPAYVSHARINEHLVAMESSPRESFRPNLNESEGKLNSENQMIYPPDFRRDFVRAGAEIDDLYRSIAAGISGTAMPTWVDSIELPSERHPGTSLVTITDLWAMAYYVQSLILERPALLSADAILVRARPQAIYLHGDPPPPPVPEDTAPMGEEFLDDEEFIEE